jgi:hypothetical protein
LKIILNLFLVLTLLVQNVYSQEKDINIEKSIEYNRKKAKVRYIKLGNTTVREVFIDGFRVSDEYIASLSDNKELYKKITSEINNKRIRNIFFSVIGLPLSSFIGYYANKETRIIYTNNRIIQNSTALGFLLNTISVFISLYSIINLIEFLNDITNINKENFLTNSQVEEIINSYNLKLKSEIFQEKKINCLHCGNNNIIIFYISKSF